MWRYEHRSQPIVPRPVFLRRVAFHAAAAAALVATSLAVGVVGYRSIAGMSWIDALLNASMILGGMGPVNALDSDAAKLFASAYALFSGIVFVITAGILVAPVAHRLLHRLHVEGETDES